MFCCELPTVIQVAVFILYGTVMVPANEFSIKQVHLLQVLLESLVSLTDRHSNLDLLL